MKATRVILIAVLVFAAAATAKKYLTPGAYVKEVPEPPRPIEGVGTSTAGRVSDEPEKP